MAKPKKKRKAYKLLVRADGTPYIKRTARAGRKTVRGGGRAKIRIVRDKETDEVLDWKIWIPFRSRSAAEKRRSSRRQLASCSLGARKAVFGGEKAEDVYAGLTARQAAALTRAANRAAARLCGPRAVKRRVPSGQAVAWMKYVGTPPPQVPGRKKNPCGNPVDVVQAEMSDILAFTGSNRPMPAKMWISASAAPRVTRAAIDALKQAGHIKAGKLGLTLTPQGEVASQAILAATGSARKLNPPVYWDEAEDVLALATMRRGQAPGKKKAPAKKKSSKAVTVGGVRIGGKKR